MSNRSAAVWDSLWHSAALYLDVQEADSETFHPTVLLTMVDSSDEAVSMSLTADGVRNLRLAITRMEKLLRSMPDAPEE